MPDTRTMRERAAQALWESSGNVPKWGTIGKARQHIVQHRIDYMAAAGVITDGTAEAERDKAIEDRNRWHKLAVEWERNTHDVQARLDAAVKVLYDHCATGTVIDRVEIALCNNLRSALTGLPTPKDQT